MNLDVCTQFIVALYVDIYCEMCYILCLLEMMTYYAAKHVQCQCTAVVLVRQASFFRMNW